jgi:hypothetical protein
MPETEHRCAGGRLAVVPAADGGVCLGGASLACGVRLVLVLAIAAVSLSVKLVMFVPRG